MMGMGGGSNKPASTKDSALQELQLNSSSQGKAVTIVYGTNRVPGNLIWYGDFQSVTTEVAQSTGGGKGFGGGGSAPTQSQTNYYAAFAFGLCEGPIAGIGPVWMDKNVTTLAALGFSLFTGTFPAQTPWGYLTTNHPGQDLSYQGLAYVGVSRFQLGANANVPNLSFEIQGMLQYGSGIVDSNPAVFIQDLLTSTQYGAGMDSAQIGDLSPYSTYCRAMSLFLSPVIDSQESATDLLARWLQLTNADAIWSQGVLKIIPYGDQAITANGATYTPTLTPVYTLTDDDFLAEDGDDPVQVTRATPADAYNLVRVEYVDRSNNYQVAVAEAKDLLSIQRYGLRPQSTIMAKEICSPALARMVVQLILQRNLYLRNTYKFRLGWKYIRLEPMDIVTLTDATLGLTQQAVRITKVEEDDAGTLSLEAQDLMTGVASVQNYTPQSNQGSIPNYQVDPGNANAPLFLCAPPILTQGNLEIWMAASGGSNWGGCFVYVSSDGTTYNLIGKMTGGSRMGTLSLSMLAGNNPDTVNACRVDLSQSRSTLISGTQTDADLFRTMCVVDTDTNQELMSYQTATLTGVNQYALTYMRRGIYDSPNVAHSGGVPFARLDEQIFAISYSQNHIGATLYVKLQSFNQYGYGVQDLSGVPGYTYNIPGPFLTQVPQGFTTKQFGGTVVFAWQPLTQWNAQGYELRYGPQGQSSWATATPLTQSTKGTEMTNASVPPGDWTFFIAGVNQAGLYSLVASSDLTVTSVQGDLKSYPQAPGWAGTSAPNCYVHWTGVLVPTGTAPIGSYPATGSASTFTPFTIWCIDPVAVAIYDAPEVDQGFLSTVSVVANIAYSQGPGGSGTPNVVLQIDWAGSDHLFSGTYQTWTGATVTARYLRFRLLQTTGSDPVFVSQFTPQLNNAQVNDAQANVTILVGGTQIFFGRTFHAPPSVVPTPISSTALLATAYNITTTSCFVKIFTTSGTDVGGQANITETGF